MTEIRAEAIWAAALSHPMRVRILRQLLHAGMAQPVELARRWDTTIDTMRRHFHRLHSLGVIERTDRPHLGGRAAYRPCHRAAAQEALWRFGAPLPGHVHERFAMRVSTIVGSQRTAVARLRARRAQLGISQSALARSVGISADTLRLIERGRIDPRLRQLLVIADELDFPPGQLFAAEPGHQADTCP